MHPQVLVPSFLGFHATQ